MEAKSVVLLLSTVWIACVAVNEFYSSTDHMIQLIDIEKRFATSLHEYIEELERQAELLKRILNAFVSDFDDTPKDPEKFVSNPLAAYRLVRKLSRVWPNTLDLIEGRHAKDVLEDLKSCAQTLPGADDVEGVVMALVRLQDMYRLDPRSIMLFSETNHNLRLDPDETFQIGTISSLNRRFQYALLWMEETFSKLSQGEEAVVTEEEVLFQLASFSHQIQLSSGRDPTEGDLQPALYKNIKESIKTWTAKYIPHFVSPVHDMNTAYEALCTGKRVMKVKPKMVLPQSLCSQSPSTYPASALGQDYLGAAVAQWLMSGRCTAIASSTSDYPLATLPSRVVRVKEPTKGVLTVKGVFHDSVSSLALSGRYKLEWKVKPIIQLKSKGQAGGVHSSLILVAARTPQRERKLVCRYRTGRGNPLVLFKEEVEWDQPTILRYHDFLSEGEMDTIKTLARPKVH
ncbi:prolyl 4-hydroxylase subunit alpha-2-like [Pimephales promelas]|uniref:prolyl 4-hydroxylase subunit alpha-2-like n=1 Tax=Pimephales promelas TaxID=90988 RepID=UPI00195596E4|nr:prolyl 4-hydroxylase subunit alpha-2-like [Pimephales promelas]